METEPRADQENFGEASLGEAQSSDPPSDPEMIEDGEGEPGAEGADYDPDADPDTGPPATPQEVDQDAERDQAEG